MKVKTVPAAYLSNKLEIKFRDLERTRHRMDKLYLRGKIYRKDIDFVYEGIFLQAVTSFEQYLETLFIGSLYNRFYYPSRKKIPKVNLVNKEITSDFVLHGGNYVDWLPFDRTEKRSGVFYTNSPFSVLNTVEKGVLNQIVAIRNAIAHRSLHSEKRFLEQVIRITSGLPEANRTPAGFLQFVYRRRPDQTKFENYLFELSSIAHKIAHYK